MTPSDTVAAVQVDGRAYTENCTADEYGATIPLSATDDEIAALLAATDLPEDTRAWRVGDVALALVARHGDEWTAAIPDVGNGVALKTWRNRRTVAAAFADHAERRQFHAMGLAWGHFAAVASLEPEDAAARLWEAVGEGWTVANLRRVVAGKAPRDDDPDPDDVSRIEFAAAAVRRWLDGEGLTLFSDVQVVGLASAVLEAMARFDRRHPPTPVPFDDPEPTYLDTVQAAVTADELPF